MENIVANISASRKHKRDTTDINLFFARIASPLLSLFSNFFLFVKCINFVVIRGARSSHTHTHTVLKGYMQ